MCAEMIKRITNKMLMDEINILREEVNKVPALKERIVVLVQKLSDEINPEKLLTKVILLVRINLEISKVQSL